MSNFTSYLLTKTNIDEKNKMSYSTFQPNAASVQAVGMSTSFNAAGAIDTTKTSEYVPFKQKYDLGNYLHLNFFCFISHFISTYVLTSF